IDVKNGGTGVAIGKVSEKDAFEVGMDIYDKSNQLISCKNVSHYDDETNGIRVICCSDMKIGGIYQVAISFNHNTAGSEHYRATIYAILSIPCGYNNSKVVVRPQINNIVTYHGNSFNTDSRLSVHVEGGGSEIECWYFNNMIYIYVTCTKGVPTSNWMVNVRPLVE
ncbi:MAG: hypothetical protein IJ272_00785, partial [Clostridia bacterium]|nr:hypothetical protein [Clostridia bacterium]